MCERFCMIHARNSYYFPTQYYVADLCCNRDMENLLCGWNFILIHHLTELYALKSYTFMCKLYFQNNDNHLLNSQQFVIKMQSVLLGIHNAHALIFEETPY
jgi:hypothetical protein